MSLILPPELHFRWVLPIPHIASIPGSGKPPWSAMKGAMLTPPRLLDQTGATVSWKAAWNQQGMAFAIEVTGVSAWNCHLDRPRESDGLHLWIDTRDTQSVHRATRYCHQLCVLPSGGGEEGLEPIVLPVPVPRASHDAKLADSDDFLCWAERTGSGYKLACWIPAEAMTGFDPTTQPRIGFFAQLIDRDLGNHPISLTSEFPFDGDPSLWLSLELID